MFYIWAVIIAIVLLAVWIIWGKMRDFRVWRKFTQELIFSKAGNLVHNKLVDLAKETTAASQAIIKLQQGGLAADEYFKVDSRDEKEVAEQFRERETRLKNNFQKCRSQFFDFYDSAATLKKPLCIDLLERNWKVYAVSEKMKG